MRNLKINSVYVIILNYQSFQDTINYVDNLQNQDEIDLHIVIVDNCSPNNSFQILKTHFSNVDYVEVIKSERNGGFAYGNNFGLKHIKEREFDYILISNNDIEILDDLLIYKMINQYKQLPKPAFVSPIMYNNNEPSICPAWKIPTLIDDLKGSLRITDKFFKNSRSYNIPKNSNFLEVDCVPGSFFLSERSIFYKLDLMDENTFLYMEESILGVKVINSGLKNYLLTHLSYNHLISKTISNELNIKKMRKHLIDSRIYFHKKYLNTSIFGLFLLKVFYQIWKIETDLNNTFRRKIK